MPARYLVPGRGCNGCTLCCKLPAVEPLDKPQGVLCKHCFVGTGCAIYEKRPDVCRDFYCGYLYVPMVGEYWHPRRSGMMLVCTPDRITVHVDPSDPEVWRREPYQSDLRRWVAQGADELLQVIVYVGRHGTILLPDRDVEMGMMDGDEHIITRQESGPAGIRNEVYALKPGDARIRPLLAGEPIGPGIG